MESTSGQQPETEDQLETANPESNATEPPSKTIHSESANNNAEGLSKKQRKRLANQDKRAEWRLAKRREEHLRKRRRLAECKAMGLETGISRKKLKNVRMADSPCKIRVAIDMSFDELMSDKEISQALKQLQFCYAANRRAPAPLQFYATGFCGRSRDVYRSWNGDQWDLYTEPNSYDCLGVGKDNIVYLTSESPNTLTQLEEDKLYVIGGLVDHNHHKGLCYRLAIEKGVSHAQLPIDNYLSLKTRKVLTINQVFEILLQWTQCRDWEQAFFTVIPKRKNPEFKSKPDLNEEVEENKNDDKAENDK